MCAYIFAHFDNIKPPNVNMTSEVGRCVLVATCRLKVLIAVVSNFKILRCLRELQTGHECLHICVHIVLQISKCELDIRGTDMDVVRDMLF